MKKILLLIGAALSGFYALGSLLILLGELSKHSIATADGISQVGAAIVPPCLGAIIFAACFNALRRKSPASS